MGPIEKVISNSTITCFLRQCLNTEITYFLRRREYLPCMFSTSNHFHGYMDQSFSLFFVCSGFGLNPTPTRHLILPFSSFSLNFIFTVLYFKKNTPYIVRYSMHRLQLFSSPLTEWKRFLLRLPPPTTINPVQLVTSSPPPYPPT